MPKVGEIFIDIFANTNRLRGSLAQASSLIRDWSLVVTGLTAGITNAFRVIASVGIKAVVISLTTLTAAFFVTAKSGAEFQDNIVRAFVIMRESSGATTESLRELIKESIRLGSETLFSATQAAIGLQTLARAGFSTQQAIAAIGPVLDLAIVGNIELAESSNIAVASMFGFGLEASDMTKVVDVLSLASSQANTTISLLGSALGFVAPVAFSAGISIEETAAAIGVLSNAGIRGSRAGTTLRRALSILLAPTGRAKKIFDELGLTFNSTEGGLISFIEIIAKLNKANLTAAETQTIFGRIAGPGMAALLRQGSGALGKLTSKLEGAQGAADRMSQSFRTTVKGRVRDLGASIINLGLAFSEKFNKPLADTIFGIRNYVKEITEALQRTGIFKAIVEGTISALSPITDKIKELTERFREFLLGLTPKDVSSFFDKIKERIEAFIAKVQDLKNSIVAFVKGGLVIVKGFIDAVIGIGKAFDTLPDTVKPVVAAIVGMTATLTALAGGVINVIGFLLIFSLIFKPLLARIAVFVGALFTGTATIAGFGAAAGAAGAGGLTVFGAALSPIIGTILIVTTLIAGLIAIVELLAGAFTAATGQGFLKGFDGVLNGLKSGIGKLVNSIPNLFGKAMDKSKEVIFGKDIFGGLPKQLQDSMKKATGMPTGEDKDGPITIGDVTFRSKAGIAAAKRSLARRKKFKIGEAIPNIARDISQGAKSPEIQAATRFLFARKNATGKQLDEALKRIASTSGISENQALFALNERIRQTRKPRGGFFTPGQSPSELAAQGINPIDLLGGAIGPSQAAELLAGKTPDQTTEEQKTKNALRLVAGLPTVSPKGISNQQANIIMLRESLVKVTQENRISQLENNAKTLIFLQKMVDQGLLTKGDLNAAAQHLLDLQSKQATNTGADDRSTTSNIGNAIGIQSRGVSGN